MKSFISLHIIPISFAILLTFLTLSSGIFNDYLFPENNRTKKYRYPQKQSGYFPNYDIGYQSEIDICNALNNGAILVIGSSELTNPSEAIPYKFIPKYAAYPTIGLGHAGNQSLSILSQLAAMSNYLENSKIVIIVSPGWFEDKSSKGTSLQSFLEYNNERFLNSIWNNKKIPKQFKNQILRYVSENIANINCSNSILRLMYCKYQSDRNILKKVIYLPLVKINKYLSNIKIQAYDMFYNKEYISNKMTLPNKTFLSSQNLNQDFNKSITINWDSLFFSSYNEAKSNATNNSWGIYNDYYSNYIKGNKGQIKPVDIKYNREYKDFTILLDLLKYYKSDAIFIIQPLNPYYYDELDKIDKIISLINNDIEQAGFSCLNLFTTDTTKYEKALLMDVMHMGDYAWYKMDKFIIEKYSKDEK